LETAPRDQQLVERILFIVARVEYFRHDEQLEDGMLGGLDQLRGDVEFCDKNDGIICNNL
jgi:hypothetical protein